MPAAFNYFLVTRFMGTEAANLTLKTIGGFFPLRLGMTTYQYVSMKYEAIEKIQWNITKRGKIKTFISHKKYTDFISLQSYQKNIHVGRMSL